MARRILKILHLLAAAGLTGALAIHMVLLATTSPDTMGEYAVVRRQIALISSKILVPSLMLALVTGFFAISVYRPFADAGWVWAKALLGLPMFEGTLMTIASTAKRAADASAQAAAGTASPDVVEQLVAREWNALWMILALSVAQTVIGVWRPRVRRRRPARSATAPQT